MKSIPLDTSWFFRLDGVTKTVTLPHDWSISSERSLEAPARGDGGYFATGAASYTRELEIPSHWPNQRVFLEFEGVAGIAETFINDVSLGTHPYAFTPFRFELTPHLRTNNKLRVEVDNSAQPSCRWYTGSGLYRRVWLHIVPESYLHNLFVQTKDLAGDDAELSVEVQLENPDGHELEFEIRNPAGEIVARARNSNQIVVADAGLWSPDSPILYTATARLLHNDELIHDIHAPFGIRTVHVSADRGFELNGQTLKLCGGNLHQDHGPLGTAVFERAEERRVELLKAAGFNAVRMAHNPPSTAFLNACDRLGLLVIDEAFDGWAKKKLSQDYALHFHDWWQRDLDAMILRDRNHPSVVMWSIGNEVFERGNEGGIAIAAQLSGRIRELDSSRPVTIGLNGLGPKQPWSDLDRVFTSLDVAGYNYEIARHTEDHQRVPERVIMSSESYQNDAFDGWTACDAHSYVIGDFVWAAWDYLGEAGLGRVFRSDETAALPWEAAQFPWHGAVCGDLDLIGHRKPVSHYRNILWNRGETLYAAVQVPGPNNRPWQIPQWAVPPTQSSWTWPGHEGRVLPVEVYSRHEAVRLYLNGRLIGEQPTGERQRFKTTFLVPYEAGTLTAVGIRNGEEVEQFNLETVGEPTRLRLTADRTLFTTSHQDLCFVTVEVTDGKGRLHPAADHSLTYTLTGPGVIVGIGNGDLSSGESYRSNPRPVFQGRALAIVRALEAGEMELTASGPRLEGGRVRLKAGSYN